jgi:hypothetical protein
MTAGECGGGDKRGKQAAALLIHTTEIYPFLDLRVDDHPDPIAELKRLYQVSLERYQPLRLPAERGAPRWHHRSRRDRSRSRTFQAAPAAMTALLEVRDLRTLFAVEAGGESAAVDGVGFSLDAGRTLGIVTNLAAAKRHRAVDHGPRSRTHPDGSAAAAFCSTASTSSGCRLPRCASCAGTGSR